METGVSFASFLAIGQGKGGCSQEHRAGSSLSSDLMHMLIKVSIAVHNERLFSVPVGHVGSRRKKFCRLSGPDALLCCFALQCCAEVVVCAQKIS